MPRIHVPVRSEAPHWQPEQDLRLDGSAARHVQVLRCQPGQSLTLFDGRGGQWRATVTAMARQHVDVVIQQFEAVERELPVAVTLAVCMPANDRMDDLVEKATELGVSRIVPLMSERSVLRLQGERATKKQAHWQSVAAAACEQCGRNRVPVVDGVQALAEWLRSDSTRPALRRQLSLASDADTPAALLEALRSAPHAALISLSGPEGGLSPEEQAAAAAAGFQALGLGRRVLRADTAPLAVMALMAML